MKKIKRPILRQEIIYNILNDIEKSDIKAVELDFDVIRQFEMSGHIAVKKLYVSFECSISKYTLIVDNVEIFLFYKKTNLYFENGLLNKMITYSDVPFNN